jgi:hypothetical protein
MNVIDSPAEFSREALLPQCLRIMCPTITPVPDYGRILEAIRVELVDICAKEFFMVCKKFGSVVGPICPFDPPHLAEIGRLKVQVEELNIKIRELTKM